MFENTRFEDLLIKTLHLLKTFAKQKPRQSLVRVLAGGANGGGLADEPAHPLRHDDAKKHESVRHDQIPFLVVFHPRLYTYLTKLPIGGLLNEIDWLASDKIGDIGNRCIQNTLERLPSVEGVVGSNDNIGHINQHMILEYHLNIMFAWMRAG